MTGCFVGIVRGRCGIGVPSPATDDSNKAGFPLTTWASRGHRRTSCSPWSWPPRSSCLLPRIVRQRYSAVAHGLALVLAGVVAAPSQAGTVVHPLTLVVLDGTVEGLAGPHSFFFPLISPLQVGLRPRQMCGSWSSSGLVASFFSSFFSSFLSSARPEAARRSADRRRPRRPTVGISAGRDRSVPSFPPQGSDVLTLPRAGIETAGHHPPRPTEGWNSGPWGATGTGRDRVEVSSGRQQTDKDSVKFRIIRGGVNQTRVSSEEFSAPTSPPWASTSSFTMSDIQN